MPVKITTSHPLFLLRNKMQENTQQFLTTFGFNYFQYLRCFADGSITALVTHTGLIEHFQHVDDEPIVFSSFEDDHAKAHTYWFLWDDSLPAYPVQLAREKFNIRNGLTLVKRSKDYYDMIAVALPKEEPNPAIFYLNKLKAIEQFVSAFEMDNKDLITVMNKNKIALPSAYRDVNYQSMCLSKGKIEVMGKYGMTHITAQELACLRLFLQGAAHKTIAQLLNISDRTVETYFMRIKQRTGFSTRLELERILAFGAVA